MVQNQHGAAFMEFLHEGSLCILNGRLGDPGGSTSVSAKGTALVDYVITPIQDFHKFRNFKVESCSEVIERCNLKSFMTERSKVPDHAILTCEFSTTVECNNNEITKNSTTF